MLIWYLPYVVWFAGEGYVTSLVGGDSRTRCLHSGFCGGRVVLGEGSNASQVLYVQCVRSQEAQIISAMIVAVKLEPPCRGQT